VVTQGGESVTTDVSGRAGRRAPADTNLRAAVREETPPPELKNHKTGRRRPVVLQYFRGS